MNYKLVKFKFESDRSRNGKDHCENRQKNLSIYDIIVANV